MRNLKKKSVSALIAHLEPFTSAFLNAPAPATVLIDRTVASNTDHLTFFSKSFMVPSGGTKENTGKEKG